MNSRHKKLSKEKDRHISKSGGASQGKITGAGRVIMGRNCLLEVLKHRPKTVTKVFVVERQTHKQSDFAQILDQVKEQDISIEYLSNEEMANLTNSSSHQSFAALVRDDSKLDFKSFLTKSADLQASLVLLVDSVSDPQNLGSILRAAECYGVDLVVWSKNRGVGITPVVSKASAGASELVTWCEVSNLVDAIDKLRRAHYWIVAAECCSDSKDLNDFEFPPKTALVIGSEGEGVHSLVSRNADFSIKIPRYGQIDSLNVAQAAAVLLHAYRRQFLITHSLSQT